MVRCGHGNVKLAHRNDGACMRCMAGVAPACMRPSSTSKASAAHACGGACSTDGGNACSGKRSAMVAENQAEDTMKRHCGQSHACTHAPRWTCMHVAWQIHVAGSARGLGDGHACARRPSMQWQGRGKRCNEAEVRLSWRHGATQPAWQQPGVAQRGVARAHAAAGRSSTSGGAGQRLGWRRRYSSGPATRHCSGAA